MSRKSLLAMAGLVVVTLTLRGCGNATLPTAPTAGRGLPDLAGAKALSNHYVEVTFTETAGEDAEEPGAYSITDVDGAVLPIDAARRSDDGTRVILTTGLQEEVEYRLSLRGKGDVVPSEADPAEVNRITTTFFGSLAAEPYLSSAISLGPTRVLLTFSEQMDGMVNVTPFYRIAAPDLHIVAASQAEGMPWVVLTTDTQENEEYTVKATNVASLANGTLIDPTRCTASFYGMPPEDDVHPTLTGATSTSATSVLLSFSEPLDDEAADPNNFSIDREVVITEAELKAYNTQVMLTTLPLTAGTEPYEAAVSNANGKVRDMQHNALDPDPSTATFTFTGQPGMDDASTLPRVVGAISTDNTHVVVIFSKPMEEGADNPSHYTIVQVNVNPEVGTLRVEDAPFVGADRTSVTLTTSSQSEVTYQVFVVNVRDQVGNPLGPVSMFADPTSATFAGTPPSGDMIDTDGDGLSDSEELRGWAVMVVLAGGETTMREVTSDPTMADTDNDGLDDAQEKRRVSDPRDPDTDDDLLDDHLEAARLFSSPTHQDTDGDGIDDFKEVDVYQTSPIHADTDGDGFDDAREVFELNRNPRIADLPRLQITVGDLALRIDERFVDQVTKATVSESSSSTTLSRSDQTQFSHSDTQTNQYTAGGGFEISSSPKLTGSFSWTGGDTSQTTRQSAQEAQHVYQSSLSKAEQFAQSVTREVVGASIDSYLNIENVGDVAFSLSNLEISAMLPGRTRDRFVPLATMLPSGELITGDEAVYNLAPFEQKGPIIISNREIYPSLVEDLMRNPRGLIFEVANYDITDEFGRNMAFQKEEVLGRTITITIDPGDGTFQRYAVATNGAYGGRCDADSENAGAICRTDRDCCGFDDGVDCPAGACESIFFGGYDEHGIAIPLPLDYVMRDILGLRKNPSGENAIVAGKNGRADTVAEGDDIQLVPIGTTGLNDRTIVVMAGENGLLDTEPSNVCVGPDVCEPNSIECCDDVAAFTTGYETRATCNADTDASINEPRFDGDGIAHTVAAGDDEQRVTPGTSASPSQVIVSAGANGILETVVAGDDEYRGHGEPCSHGADCPNGACDGREVLVRYENSKTGDPNRFWVVMTSEEICQDPPEECPFGIPAGSDFGDIPLRPTQAITLAFGQDIDRDGLFAREEFIYGSSDQKKDTDNDTLGDFAEIREGWEVDVVGCFPEQVYPDPRFVDSDFDGLQDPDEKDCLTDPTKRDTDGDGLFDSVELGRTTDFNGNDNIDDFERGFGRCCEGSEGFECASEPTIPCLSNDDCSEGLDCTLYEDLTDVCPPQAVPAEWPERLDPRNPDTDGDSIEDGNELELGLNPLNPYDADAFRDADEDGLYDVDEMAGWEVSVTLCSNTCDSAFDGVCDSECEEGTDCADCGHTTRTETVFSDPLEGDSDFDGLPDYLERELGTNPTDDDTDCDGILDYDEFSEFGAYMNLTYEYPGFYLNGSNSREHGTDPTSQDTDGDLLSDYFELNDGWRVLACTDDAPRNVHSDPLYFDTDLDGLSDRQEYFAGRGPQCPPECAIGDDCPAGLECILVTEKCAVNLVQNGEFTDQVHPDDENDPWQEVLIPDNPDPGSGWQSGPGWNGEPGLYWLNHGAGTEVEVRQEITGLTPGDTYVVSGYYKTGLVWQAGPSFEVLLDDEVLFEGGSESVDVWTRFEFTYVASSSAATLQSRGQVGSDSDYYVDGVQMARLEYPQCRPTDPTDPDTDGDGYLDSQETFPLGCGKKVTVRIEDYFVGACTCNPIYCTNIYLFHFDFTLEHNGEVVAAPPGTAWQHVVTYSFYPLPADWWTTIVMRPGDYIDIFLTATREGSVECRGFNLRKTYDELKSEIVSQGPTGCEWCFGDHRFGLRFLVEP